MNTYFDSLTIAAQHAQDWHLPDHLLPLVITNEASLRSFCEAGHSASGGW
jgi:hypothetical protein